MVAKRIPSTLGANVPHYTALRKTSMDAKASIRGEISLNILKVRLWNKLERDIADKDCRGSCIQKQVMESTSLAIIKACCQSSEILASVAKVVP